MVLKLNILILVSIFSAMLSYHPALAQSPYTETKKNLIFSSELADKHFYNALSLHKKGFLELAVPEYERAIKLYPGHIESYVNLALIKCESGDNIPAIRYLTKALQINPEYPTAHYNLGVIYQVMGQYLKAESSYLSSIKYDANNVEAYTNLGKIYETFNRPLEAFEEYKKALKINPKFDLAKFNMGRLFLSLAKYKYALVYFKSILEDNPKNGVVRFYMAVTYYFLKEYSTAWHNVHLAKKLGSPADQKFLRALSMVMPEYQNAI